LHCVAAPGRISREPRLRGRRDVGRSESGTHDARLPGEVSWTDFRLRPQQRRELVETLADRTAEDEHVGPEHGMTHAQVLVHARDPRWKVEILFGAHARGCP